MVPDLTRATVPSKQKHGRRHHVPKQRRASTRARAETAAAGRKQGIGDGLRSRKDRRRAADVEAAVHAPNRMLELGRPALRRTAWPGTGLRPVRLHARSMQRAALGRKSTRRSPANSGKYWERGSWSKCGPFEMRRNRC